MSVIGIGSSINGYSIGQMMSRMQPRGSSTDGVSSAGAKEKPDLSQLVAQLDTDSSGSLESGEIQNLADAISGATGVSVDLEEFLSTYDTNKDASLSSDEAVSALEANPPQGPPPGSGGGHSIEQDMVNSADSNGDGVISADEAGSLVDIINNATGSSLEAGDFVSNYDSNGDGSFSADEAVAAMESNRPQGPPPPGGTGNSIEEDVVSAVDSNGDGVISADEAAGLVDIINNATGSSLNVDDFMSNYDSNDDGSFSTDEAVAAMTANRPQVATTTEDKGMTAALETYMTMSALGSQNTGDLLTLMMGNTQESINRMV